MQRARTRGERTHTQTARTRSAALSGAPEHSWLGPSAAHEARLAAAEAVLVGDQRVPLRLGRRRRPALPTALRRAPSLPPSLPRLLWSRCVARSTARSSTAKCEGAKSLKSFTLVLAHGSPGADVSGLVSASALAVQTTPPTPELRLYEPRPKPFAFDQSFGTPGAALSAPATTPAAESAPRRAGPARTPAAPATESANGAVYHL